MAVNEKAQVVQLDMFINEQRTREEIEYKEFKKYTERSIRGLFARYNDLEGAVLALHDCVGKLMECMESKKA